VAARSGFHTRASSALGGNVVLTIYLGNAAPHPQHGRLCLSVLPPAADPLMSVSRCLPPALTAQLAQAAPAGAAAASFLLSDSAPGSSVHASLLTRSGLLATFSLELPLAGHVALLTAAGESGWVQPQQPRLTLVQAQ
jgi:hypothetical protein